VKAAAALWEIRQKKVEREKQKLYQIYEGEGEKGERKKNNRRGEKMTEKGSLRLKSRWECVRVSSIGRGNNGRQ